MNRPLARTVRMPRKLNPPEDLARLAANPRILVRRDGPPRPEGKCVVYWMQRAMRIHENPALDVAIDAGNLLGLPVVVSSPSFPTTPTPTCGTTTFCSRACAMWRKMQQERGVGFVLRRHPDNSLEDFSKKSSAAHADRRRESLPRARALAQGSGQPPQTAVLDRRCRRRGAFSASLDATISCCITFARI